MNPYLVAALVFFLIVAVVFVVLFIQKRNALIVEIAKKTQPPIDYGAQTEERLKPYFERLTSAVNAATVIHSANVQKLSDIAAIPEEGERLTKLSDLMQNVATQAGSEPSPIPPNPFGNEP